MTYALLNLIVMFNVLLIAWRPIRQFSKWHSLLIVLAIMLLLTMVFDSLIIHFEIVAYDESLNSNFRIINAPIEDFAYTIVAAILGPILWTKFKQK